MHRLNSALTITVAIIVITGTMAKAAAPPRPSSFHGAVILNGSPAPAGSLVSAWIDGVKFAEIATAPEDDPFFLIDVPADDPDTPALEGGQDGDTIIFQVDGFEADQTALWSDGTLTELDLTATPPPTAPLAEDQTVVTDEDIATPVTLTALDVNGDVLSYTIVLSPTHGQLSGTPPTLTYLPEADYNGDDSFTFQASDGVLDSNIATISLTVTPLPDAPRIAPIGSQLLAAGVTREVTVSAVDPDGDPVSLAADNLPAFASFVDNGDGTGSLTLTPNQLQSGVYPSVEINASDGSLTDREFFTIRVDPSTEPDLTVAGLTASDPAPPQGATVTLTAEVCNDGLNPAQDVVIRFFQGDPAGGGTPLGADQIIASLTADACHQLEQTLNTSGLTGSQLLYAVVDPDQAIPEASDANNQLVTVINIGVDIANLPPAFVSVPSLLAQVDATYSYRAAALDLNADPLTYALLNGPAGMTIDASTGWLTWRPRSFQVGEAQVEIEVRDGRGGLDRQTFVITVSPLNDPPLITSTPPLEAAISEAYEYQIEATDPDGDGLSYALLQSPTGMGINFATGLIRWTPLAGQEGVHNVIVQVVDDRGAETRQTFSLRIVSDEFGPDLVVAAVNNRPLETDTQALTISGPVQVTVGNAGSVDVTDAFELLLYYNEDDAGDFDSGVDTVLGQTTLPGLAAREILTVPVELSSTLRFRDDLIYALIDSSEQVTEADETNNLAHSGQSSQFHPNEAPFTPELEWAWTGSTVEPEFDDVMMTPLVVNLTDDNGDGQIDEEDIADVVFVSTTWPARSDGILRAISGADGSPLWDVTDLDLRVGYISPIAAGDLDGDGLVEIVAPSWPITSNGDLNSNSPNLNRLLIFEHDGIFKRAGDFNFANNFQGTISIIDMDSDGSPEIVLANAVFNADGTLRFQGAERYAGAAIFPDGPCCTVPSSVVADLDLDGQAELLTGIVAYRADGSIYYDLSDDAAHFQNYLYLGPEYDTGGYSAVANFNDDPYPEIVLVSGALVSLLDHTGSILWQTTVENRGGYATPTIADFDGDGRPEIGTAGWYYYYVIDDDGTLLWKAPIIDSSVQSTAVAFDFEGDGAVELVYADEEYLRVFRGRDGAVLFQVPNPSGTLIESPVVADVDNDGQAEIIVSRNQFGDHGTRTGTFNSGIFVYGDRWDNWVGTRRIWNQHTYNITGVNEDGTIPVSAVPNWQAFNNFRQNQAFPQGEGAGPFAVPDLTASLIQLDQTTCPTSALVTARIGNGGGDLAPAGVPISFYDGNPAVGAPLIDSVSTTQLLRPGEFEDVSVSIANPTAGPHRLTVIADDGGEPVLVESDNLIPLLDGVRISDSTNIVDPEYAIDTLSGEIEGNIIMAQAPFGDSSFEVTFPFPINLTALTVSVPRTPLTDFYPLCDRPIEVSMTLSNGFSTPLNIVCSLGGPHEETLPPFYSPPFPVQQDVTSLRLDFSIGGFQRDQYIGELILSGSFSDPEGRQGLVAEGREDNNRAFFTTAICGDLPGDNLPPEILSSPVLTAVQETLYEYQVIATDLDGDPLTYTLAVAPAGMSIDANLGLVNWTPQTFQAGDFPVAVEVSDGRGGLASQAYTITVSPANLPPLFTSTPISTAQVGLTYNYTAQAVDPEGTSLTYALLSAPSGMSINPDIGLIQWLPFPSQVGRHPVTVQAQDAGGATAEQSFLVTVAADIAGPDLLVSLVDNRPSQTDLRTLDLDGQVTVTFGNGGDTDLLDDVELLLFADLNENSRYDSGSDRVLGSLTQTGGLAAGQFVTQAIDVSGPVLFRDNLIYAFVDSDDVVAEVDENNNLRRTGDFSRFQPPPGEFSPVVETTIQVPSQNIIIHGPLVANFNDDNGDGQIDENDIADILILDAEHTLRVYRGDTGQQLWSRRRSFGIYNFFLGAPAVGDIDQDGLPEVVIQRSTNNQILVFDHTGSPKYVSETWPVPVSLRSTVHLANIDRTGPPEILIGNVILNSDGTLRCQGSAGRGTRQNYWESFVDAADISVAVDLDLTGDLELVAGNTAYRSDCSIMWENTGVPSGWTSVANLDDDPNPEIVLLDSNNSLRILEHDGSNKAGPVTAPGGGIITGLPVIADFDGDGRPEIGVGAHRYTVFEGDLSVNWSKELGGRWLTGSTAFDFESDGQAEILVTSRFYDSPSFYILRGRDGAVLFRSDINESSPQVYPVVADVDNDGNAEVIIVDEFQGIYVFGDDTDNWVSARPIWNQHAYHITNINDDGSIPQSEANHFSTFNNFLQNLSSDIAPDLTASRITVDQATCPATVQLGARIGNGGGATVPAGTPVTFIDGVPGQGGEVIGETLISQELAPGAHEDVTIPFDSPIAGVHGITAIANLQFNFDNLNRLPEVIVEASSSHPNGPAPDLAIDGIANTEWCAADSSPYLQVTFPSSTTVSSATFEWGNNTISPFTQGTLQLSNGYNLPVTLDPAGSTFTFPEQSGITWARFTSNQQSCLGEFILGGTFYSPQLKVSALGEGREDNNTATQALALCEGFNNPPAITSAPGLTASVTSTYSYTVEAGDADGDPLTFELLLGPTGMTVEAATGFLQWTPTAEQIGLHNVSLQVSDGRGGLDVQSYGLTILPPSPAPNLAPTCEELTMVLDEDTTVSSSLPCTDPDAADIMITEIISPTVHGTIGVAVNQATYVPDADYNGPDQFTFRAKDSNDNTSDVATATITVNPVNDIPVANDQTITVTEDISIPLTLTALDIDNDSLSYTIIITPFHGATTGTEPDLTYTPETNYGGPDVLTFQANDGQADSQIATVYFTIDSTNDPPFAVDDTFNVDENSTGNILDILANDNDVDDDPLEITFVSTPLNGNVAISGTSSLVYTPTLNYDGDDVFTYTITDGSLSDTATVTVTVNNVIEPPDLLLRKARLATDSVAVGEVVSFTITITNSGQTLLTTIPLTDTYDPNFLAFVRGDPDPDGNVAGRLSWTNLTESELLAPGESLTVEVAFQALDTTDTLPNQETVNTAEVEGTEDELGQLVPLYTSQASLQVTVLDLQVSKENGQDTVQAGQTLTYTLTISNVGSRDAVGVTITDTLPTEGSTYVSASDGGSEVGDMVTWPAFDLAAKASVTRTVTVRINELLPAGIEAITNTVEVADDGTNGIDPTPEDNTASDTDSVIAAPDLVLSKDNGQTTVQPGDTVTYTLRIDNAGSQAATGILLTDTLPTQGVTFVSASNGGSESTGLVTWPSFTLAGGASATRTVTVRINDPIPSGLNSLTNSASVSDDGSNGPDPMPANNSASDTDSVIAAPDLVLSKDDGQSTVQPGNTVTYTLRIDNAGSQAATGILLTDTLPTQGITFISASSGGSESAGLVSWPSFTLAGGASATRTITIRLEDPLPVGLDSLTNAASVSDDGTNGPDPTPSNNSASDTDIVFAAPDLVLSKDNGQSTVQSGGTITYTLRIVNAGSQAATGVLLTDTLPTQGITLVNASNGGSENNGLVTWPTFSLAGGASATRTVTIRIDDPLPAGLNALTNSASVADDGSNGPEPTPANNSASDTDAVLAEPDLVLSKDNGQSTVQPGDTVTYTLRIDNAGSQAATGVLLTDTLPTQGVTFVSASGGGSESGGLVTWPAFSLAGGASATQTITVRIDDPLPAGLSALTNTASVADDGTNGPDPTPANNSTSDTDSVIATPDLVLSKDNDQATVQPGNTVTYTLRIDNAGSQAATGVLLTDNLPTQGVILISASNGGSENSGLVTWPAFSLAGGASATRTVTVRIDDPLPAGLSILTNSASVSDDGSNGPDPTPANNSASDTDTVIAAPDLVLSKDNGQSTVQPGDTVTYTLRIVNAGSQAATGVLLTDILPTQGVTFVSASSGGSESAGLVTWPSFTLVGGASATRTVTVRIDDPIPSGLNSITNSASVSDDGTNGSDPTPGNNSANDTDTVTIVIHPPVLAPIPDQTLVEGANLDVPLSATDADGDPIRLTAAGLPGFASLTDNGDGSGLVSLAPGFTAAGVYPDVTISASDGLLTDTQRFTITVTDFNRPPLAGNQALSTPEDTPLNITLTGLDPDGDLLTFSLVSLPISGTLGGLAPSLVYTPSLDFHGQDRFTYQANDGLANSQPATVTITVTPVNDPPDAVDDLAGTTQGNAITIDVLANDSDPDGDNLTVNSVGQVLSGTVTLNPDDSLTYTPNAGFSGTDVFSYTIGDGQGAGDTALVSVQVAPEDALLPLCRLEAIRPGSPVEIELVLQDGQSGLSAINLLAEANAVATVPTFAAGTTNPVTVTVELDTIELVDVRVEAADLAGNVSVPCGLSGEVVNSSLGLNYSTAYNNSTLTFSLFPTWQHVSGGDILAPVGVKVTSLYGSGCPCTVSDDAGQSGGVGTMFKTPLVNDLADGVMSSGEQFRHDLHVHLSRRANFSFYVDIWGIRFSNSVGMSSSSLTISEGQESFKVEVTTEQLRDNGSLYLPLIIKTP